MLSFGTAIDVTEYSPSNSNPTSNETEAKSTSSNAIISVDNEESELPKSKELPVLLIYETPK